MFPAAPCCLLTVELVAAALTYLYRLTSYRSDLKKLNGTGYHQPEPHTNQMYAIFFLRSVFLSVSLSLYMIIIYFLRFTNFLIEMFW